MLKEGVGSAAAVVTSGCWEQSSGSLESGSLKEQQILLTTESSLQSLTLACPVRIWLWGEEKHLSEGNNLKNFL